MRPEIRHLFSFDIDPGTYVPEDPDNFMFAVRLLAGPEGEEGEESFDFVVCTPGWLLDEIRREGPMTGRHHVIVDRFDWPALEAYVRALMSRCEGADWHEVGTRLSRYGFWEFEDYTEA